MSDEPTDRGSRAYDAALTSAYLIHRHGGTASPNVVMEEPAFFDALGEVGGQRVLDLGCGDGSLAARVLEAGAASHLGIDGSPAMIEVAKAQQNHPGARFEVADLEDLHIEPGSVDLVTSRMAFHYVADLDSLLRRVRRGLAPGGRLLFTTVHPVVTSSINDSVGPRTTWTVDQYFVPGPRHRPWFGATVTWHHRTVEAHLQALTQAGFRLEHLGECAPSGDRLADDPGELARRRRVPLMLLLGGTAT